MPHDNLTPRTISAGGITITGHIGQSQEELLRTLAHRLENLTEWKPIPDEFEVRWQRRMERERAEGKKPTSIHMATIRDRMDDLHEEENWE